MNLWSFSNSGAGASCSIDRVPNELLRRLALLRKRHKGELARILNTPALSSSFWNVCLITGNGRAFIRLKI